MIVADASAVPPTLGVVIVDDAGIAVSTGAAGAAESSMYVKPAEHGDVLFALSFAVAWNVVDEFAPTETFAVNAPLPSAVIGEPDVVVHVSSL